MFCNVDFSFSFFGDFLINLESFVYIFPIALIDCA